MRTGGLLILVLAALFLFFFLWQYVFNIYEIKIEVTPSEKDVEPGDTVYIKAVPVNSYGAKAWFRNSEAEISVREGADLVTILEEDHKKGMLKLEAKNPGKVVVTILSEYALAANYVKFSIKNGK